jgi:hypothetical protein
MSQGARAGLALALAIAAIAAIPIGLTWLCIFGWVFLAIPILALAAWLLVRTVDPEYSDHPRLSRLALAIARPLAQLVLFMVVTSPFWLVGVGDLQMSRRSQSRARAIAEARAVRDAEREARRAAGVYVGLECLAQPSQCPPGVTLTTPPRPALLEPERLGYRFALYRAPQGDAFAYVGVPVVSPRDCPMQATGNALVCADSTGLLCTMAAAADRADVHCPTGCMDVAGPRPSASPYPPESAASASTQGGVASPRSSR